MDIYNHIHTSYISREREFKKNCLLLEMEDSFILHLTFKCLPWYLAHSKYSISIYLRNGTETLLFCMYTHRS